MANTRFDKDMTPDVPHLEDREFRDLRNDTIRALSKVADSLGINIEITHTTPVAGASTITCRALNGPGGPPVSVATAFELAVFSDPDGTFPSGSAALDTATVGTILAGGGSAAIKAKTNTSGVFTCVLSDGVVESVYLAAEKTFTGPKIDFLGSHTVVFA